MLNRKEVIKKLETAFIPFRCTPELQDYDSKFGFAVFDTNDNILIKKDKIPFTNEKEFPKGKLDALISTTNLQIQEKQNKK